MQLDQLLLALLLFLGCRKLRLSMQRTHPLKKVHGGLGRQVASVDAAQKIGKEQTHVRGVDLRLVLLLNKRRIRQHRVELKQRVRVRAKAPRAHGRSRLVGVRDG